MKSKILMMVDNHFDPMWRRPFRRQFEYDGKRFLCYADIERMYILRNMEMAEADPDYRFGIESPLVAEVFLEENPDQRDRLETLIRRGQATVDGAGYVIIDANMALGESIIRNYLLELRWRKQEQLPAALLAIRKDAFGNCAQLPQILRGFHYRWVGELDYVRCPEDYWRGMDGSTVCTAALPKAGGMWNIMKLAPCPRCSGRGRVLESICPDCGGSGVDPRQAAERHIPVTFQEDFREPVGMAEVGGEEYMPTEQMFREIEKWKDRYDLVFAFREDAYEALKEKIEAVDSDLDPASVHPSPELNPCNTGCYVSRIKTKQAVRHFEYALMANDALASAARLQPGEGVPRSDRLWKSLMYFLFHDAVTGTHVDAAYEELKEAWKDTENGLRKERRQLLTALRRDSSRLTVFNPTGYSRTEVLEFTYPEGSRELSALTGEEKLSLLENFTDFYGRRRCRILVKDLGPYSAASADWTLGTLEPAEALADRVIENEFYTVTADDHGVLAIRDRRLDREIAAEGEYRPFEWIMSQDDGSPWATLGNARRDDRLAPDTRLLRCEKRENYQRLVFRVEAPPHMGGCTHSLEITCALTLWRGIPRVDFSADAGWNNYNKRLRLAMPLTQTGRHIYETPFGALERKPYTPEYYGWAVADGTWPAVNWAGVEGSDASVALLNRGTPSYKICDGDRGSTVFLSVLRSPADPTYLHEEYSYRMQEYDGMRDMGMHHFDCALTSFSGSFGSSSVSQLADSYNGAFITLRGELDLPEMPSMVSGSGYISCIKPAEEGGGLILRAVETAGKPGTLSFTVPAGVHTVSRAEMTEEALETLPLTDHVVEVPVRPYEILTLRMDL